MMAVARPRALRRLKRSWATTAVVCLCSMAGWAPAPSVGDAFLLSSTSTRSPLQQQCRTTSHTSCKTSPKDVEETITFEDGDDDETDDEDEEDDIHPSVAWLYQSSAPRTTEDERSSRKKKLLRRTLCVDYGTRRVGLAMGMGISPRVVPGVTNRGSDLEVVRQVLVRARGEGARDIVVGLPLVRNGTETEMCETVRSFASVLADAGAASRPPANVYLWDERFSSAQAEALLDPNGGGVSSKVEIDSLAASLILEHYFAEGGSEYAEKVEACTATSAILLAAGRRGKQDEDEEQDEDNLFGEDSRRRLYAMRAESIRSTAAGEDITDTRALRKRRKRRK